MTFTKKLLFPGAGALALAVGFMIAPALSFANYTVSPSFNGTPTMSISSANQICGSLPDGIAAQQSFCAPGAMPAMGTVSIADHDILISATSSTSVHITWTTTTPTTTSLWYSDSIAAQAPAVQYTNTAEGYSYTHSIDITNINLMPQHLFRVGGNTQTGNNSVTSYLQLL